MLRKQPQTGKMRFLQNKYLETILPVACLMTGAHRKTAEVISRKMGQIPQIGMDI